MILEELTDTCPQVLPSYIPPPQRGANIRLPSFPVRPAAVGGPRVHHPASVVAPGPPGYGPIVLPSIPLPPETPRDDSATDDASEQEEDVATKKQPVVSGIWNQDLMIISNGQEDQKKGHHPSAASASSSSKTIKTLNPNIGGWDVMLSESSGSDAEEKPKKVTAFATTGLFRSFDQLWVNNCSFAGQDSRARQ
jgi:hypothetical protein